MGNKKAHCVIVCYKPEGDEKFSSQEMLRFSKQKDAKDFVKRQLKLSQVLSARYTGAQE